MLEVNVKQKLGSLDLDVQLNVPLKGITAVFGRSGSGKTSLVNTLSGLTSPDAGVIRLGKRILFDSGSKVNLAPEKRNIGYVFQDARLFPHYKVEGNLLYGCGGKRPTMFQDVITLLDIEPLLQRYPASLSGGEKQRVAIGRALLSAPDLLLMDEPLASLDLPRKREVMPYLERLAKEIELPILYVTHSLDEILRLADSMVLLNRGKAELTGPIDEVWSSPFMRPWLPITDQSALLEGQLCHHHEQYEMSCIKLAPDVGVWVKKLAAQPQERVRVRIRANDVSLVKVWPSQSSIRNILPAKVSKIEHDQQHDIVAVQLQIGRCVLWANITSWAFDELKLSVGESVFAQIKGVSVTQSDLAMM